MPDEISIASPSGEAPSFVIPNSSTPRYVGPPDAPIDIGSNTGLLPGPEFTDLKSAPQATSPPQYSKAEGLFAGLTTTAWGIMLLANDTPTFEFQPGDNIQQAIKDMQGEAGYQFKEVDVAYLSRAVNLGDLSYRKWQLEQKQERNNAMAQNIGAGIVGAVVDYDIVLGGVAMSGARALGAGTKAARASGGVAVAGSTYGSYKAAEWRTPYTTEEMVLHTLISGAAGMMGKLPDAPRPSAAQFNPQSSNRFDLEDEFITASQVDVQMPVAAPAPPIVVAEPAPLVINRGADSVAPKVPVVPPKSKKGK